MLNEGGEDSIMSTPNMSFDSPIIVTKSNFAGVDKQKDPSTVEPSTKTDGETDSKEAKLEEEKRAKKRDMFAPEADMFADEYSVSLLSVFIECAHIQFQSTFKEFNSLSISLQIFVIILLDY